MLSKSKQILLSRVYEKFCWEGKLDLSKMFRQRYTGRQESAKQTMGMQLENVFVVAESPQQQRAEIS